MGEHQVKTIPVVKDGELLGVITTGDIAMSYMDVHDNHILSEAKTQYRNILKTLNGTMLVGNEHGQFSKGRLRSGHPAQTLWRSLFIRMTW